jgi:hypothetical protein
MRPKDLQIAHTTIYVSSYYTTYVLLILFFELFLRAHLDLLLILDLLLAQFHTHLLVILYFSLVLYEALSY